jgi:hypothetical protein
VETVVKKLSKANIAAYNVKKRENVITFQVNDESIKKVFAIFKHPCYNINIRKSSTKNKLLTFARNRLGLIVGFCIFLSAVICSNSFVLKIQVTGNGNYLKDEVLGILYDEGVTFGSLQSRLDKPLAQSRIMALPNVTFCTIQQSGSFLIVDVQTDDEQALYRNSKVLTSDVNGKLINLVVICGTAQVEVGNNVKVGDNLICNYLINSEGERQNCLAVGYADIEISCCITVSAPTESEEEKQKALNATLLYSENANVTNCTAKKVDGGVVYEITFTYPHTIAINIQ